MLLYFIGILFKIILILIGLFILLQVVALFIPMRYYFTLNRLGELETATKSQLIITWLFKLVKLEYKFAYGKNSVKLSILGMDALSLLRKVSKLNATENSQKKQPKQETHNRTAEPKNEDNDERPTFSEHDKDEQSEELERARKPKTQRIFAKIKDILNKVQAALKYEDRDEIIRLSILFIKRLYRATKPKQFWVRGEIGLENPAATGYLFAGIGVLHGVTGMDIQLKGNFEKSVQDLQIMVKGKLKLWLVLWAFGRYLFAKPIWKIVKKIFFKKGDLYGE